MGKTSDLFKKLRHTKGAFHAKMGTIRNRNGLDLTEAEDIKKRCNTQKNCTKKFFRDFVRSNPLNLFLTSTVYIIVRDLI